VISGRDPDHLLDRREAGAVAVRALHKAFKLEDE